jgi:septal ring factor EnvC (AmiA/AmiB activator)
MMRSRRWLASLSILIAISWPGLSFAKSEAERELMELREAIRESRERVAAYEREQRGLLETLEALDRAIFGLGRQVTQARLDIERTRQTLKDVESEAVEIRKRRAKLEGAMSSRAVALYKAGSLGSVQLLFAAEGLQDLLSRLHTLKLLLGHDAKLLEQHRVESVALVDAEARAREALRGRDAALARLRERSAQLAQERETKRELVARVHLDRSNERAALVEMETAGRALEETLVSLGQKPERSFTVKGPAFEELRKELPLPVEGRIVESFGLVVDAEFKTETFRNGVSFEARQGASVRAVARGQVRFAGWFRGYGKLVIIDHGGEYFTVMGHLEEIRVDVGDEVRPRSVIGTVGDTGSLVGPRLYFEVRRGGEPQDPGEWLHVQETG